MYWYILKQILHIVSHSLEFIFICNCICLLYVNYFVKKCLKMTITQLFSFILTAPLCFSLASKTRNQADLPGLLVYHIALKNTLRYNLWSIILLKTAFQDNVN